MTRSTKTIRVEATSPSGNFKLGIGVFVPPIKEETSILPVHSLKPLMYLTPHWNYRTSRLVVFICTATHSLGIHFSPKNTKFKRTGGVREKSISGWNVSFIKIGVMVEVVLSGRICLGLPNRQYLRGSPISRNEGYLQDSLKC